MTSHVKLRSTFYIIFGFHFYFNITPPFTSLNWGKQWCTFWCKIEINIFISISTSIPSSVLLQCLFRLYLICSQLQSDFALSCGRTYVVPSAQPQDRAISALRTSALFQPYCSFTSPVRQPYFRHTYFSSPCSPTSIPEAAEVELAERWSMAETRLKYGRSKAEVRLK